MLLREFIVLTLGEINEAVRECHRMRPQIWISGTGAVEGVTPGFEKVLLDDSTVSAAQSVEFEVQVTTTRGTGAEGKAGLEVLGAVVGLATKAQSSTENRDAHVVRFKIPLVLPVPAANT